MNTIREFAVHDGDIAVEVFEKASSDLQKALAGEAESAISEGEAAAPAESEMSADPAPQNEKSNRRLIQRVKRRLVTMKIMVNRTRRPEQRYRR